VGDVGLYQGALFYGESHLRKREYLKASQHFARAADGAEGPERELARGLLHLAAAGQKGLCGDRRGRDRQLAHAHRRLAPFLPSSHRLNLKQLIEIVASP
jgi:hypothetical protein